MSRHVRRRVGSASRFLASTRSTLSSAATMAIFPIRIYPDPVLRMEARLVESVDEYSKKIEALGGKVIVPKMEVPNMGFWAMAIDPEGNHFAVWEEIQK